MTQPSDLEERIRTILYDRLQIEAPPADQDLIEAGILDSLSFVDLLVAIEEEFSIRIVLDSVDLNNFRSVAMIANYIAQQKTSPNEVALGRHSTV